MEGRCTFFGRAPKNVCSRCNTFSVDYTRSITTFVSECCLQARTSISPLSVILV